VATGGFDYCFAKLDENQQMCLNKFIFNSKEMKHTSQ
jgi:hypothetical protein